jgi:hypothetical protein
MNLTKAQAKAIDYLRHRRCWADYWTMYRSGISPASVSWLVRNDLAEEREVMDQNGYLKREWRLQSPEVKA